MTAAPGRRALAALLLAAACSTPAPTSGPSDTASPTSEAPSVAWETVLTLGPVSDVVVTGGAFDSPGRFLVTASCTAPGRLVITTDDGPLTYLCPADGAPESRIVDTGRRGRTVIEVDSGALSRWSVVVAVPPE